MAKSKKSKRKQPTGQPRHFKKTLRGSFDHYSSALFSKYGLLLRVIFSVFFRKTKLAETDVKKIDALSKKGAIIYVIRNRSRLEYLMLGWVLKKHNLPDPNFAHYISMWWWLTLKQTWRRIVSRIVTLFERQGYPNPYTSGFVAHLLQSRTASLLPARDFSGLPWRFGRSKPDPLADIIQIQRKHGMPVYLLPIEIAYGRRPDRQTTGIGDLLIGTKVNPSKFRELIMFLRNRRETSLLVSDPISLEDLVEEQAILAPKTAQRDSEIAYMIRTHCIEMINRERRVLLGPVLKSKSEVVESILHEREMFEFLQDLSKADEKDYIALRRDAKKMLEEIAADYNPTTVRIMNWILRKAFRRQYAGIEINKDRLEQVRAMSKEMPLVYIPCHKSHIDYLIMSHMLFLNRMAIPFIVAGVNLNFWPLGPIFRGGGAFFMRRTFKGKRLYSKVFAKYIEYLVRENIPIEFFIEGTRSRTGKIVLPRLGFLSILLEAVRKSGRTNMGIVPVSLNYDRIFEATFYLNEATGKKNEGENLNTMLKHRKLIKAKQGKLYIEIAKPFTLADLLWESHKWIPEDRESIKQLAGSMSYRVAHDINSESVVNPYSVVCAVLLANTHRGIYLSQVNEAANLLLGFFKARDIKAYDFTAGWVESALYQMVKEKILGTETDDDKSEADEDALEEDVIFFLDGEKRMSLTIYKNAIIHHYQFLSLLSLAFIAQGEPANKETLFEKFCFIKKMMADELIYSENKEQTEGHDRLVFEKAFEFFTGHGFLSYAHDRYMLDKSGRRAAKLFAGSLLDFVESYYILLRTLSKFRKKNLSIKDWIKRAMKKGKRLASTGEIIRNEAVHKNIIESGLRHMVPMGVCEVITEEDKGRTERLYHVKDLVKLQEILDQLKPYLER